LYFRDLNGNSKFVKVIQQHSNTATQKYSNTEIQQQSKTEIQQYSTAQNLREEGEQLL